MRILSARRQFLADHSSTNYLFFAAKPLSKEARAVVSRLSSHVDVHPRRATITYNFEGADLDEARRLKFLEHYDVEVREDYDWWALSVMLEKARLEVDLSKYTTEGEASLTFEECGARVRLRLEGTHLDYNAAYHEFGEDIMEGMAELGLALRDEVYDGQVDALAVIERYCDANTILSDKRGNPTPVGKTLRQLLDPL